MRLSDCNLQMSTIEAASEHHEVQEFNRIAEEVRHWKKISPADAEYQKLYGLYMQATEGDYDTAYLGRKRVSHQVPTPSN